MRISTAYPQQFNANLMLDQQAKMNETQLKISSGKKHLTPAENPSAAAYSLSFNQSIGEAAQYQDNISSVVERLKHEESALANVIDVVQRLQELGLQGMNDSGHSQSARGAIATELDQLNEQLMGLANTRGANGEYIFSGAKTNIMPFSKADVNAQAFSLTQSANTQSNSIKAAEPVAISWVTYVEKKATQDVYAYLSNRDNSGKTMEEALASFKGQNSQYIAVDQLGKLAAAQGHTVFPDSWTAAWDSTSGKYESAFAMAFNAVKTSKEPIALVAEVNLAKSRVVTAAAYDSYTKVLASYAESAYATASVSTPKSEAWVDYIQKQAAANAYDFVSNYPLDKLKDLSEVRDIANIKNLEIQKLGTDLAIAQRNAVTADLELVTDPTGTNLGNQGTLALRKSAEKTDAAYKAAFELAYQQAVNLRKQLGALDANSEFNNTLSAVSGASTNAWKTYSLASDKIINVAKISNTTAITGATAIDGAAANTAITLPSSTFIYSGSTKYRDIQIGSGRVITDGDVGTKVFGLPSSSDQINGRKIFDSVKDFSQQLRSGEPTLETLQEFDEVLANVSAIRSSIGARMNVLDRQKQTNEDFIINTKTALSQIEDLDYTQAITQLNSQQLSLQAAQQSYSKVQGMSLFKFL